MNMRINKYKNEQIERKVQFLQWNKPGLQAGTYKITVSQTVKSNEFNETFKSDYRFAVLSKRFSLDPQDIYAVFPPDHSEGEFMNCLPHVVLAKQTLPWMRSPTRDDNSNSDVATWLAVLLFDDDDVSEYQDFTLRIESKRVEDLWDNDGMKGGCSYFYPGKNKLNGLQVDEKSDDICQVIDVPMDLFQKVAPSLEDLKMTSHIRRVKINSKATQNDMLASRSDLSGEKECSNFAVVFGNRLPQKGKRSVAVLVSLEGLGDYLPKEERKPAGEKSNDRSFIRLVCLKTWSFTATGDGSSFVTLLTNLQPKSANENKGGEQAKDFSIGIPIYDRLSNESEAANKVKNALAMGYAAFPHQTRDGGQTVSWYRGPLAPYPVAPNILPPDSTFSSADAAIVYDPDTGMFDVSYAAAWQLGRLLALKAKDFSVALYNWRRNNIRDDVTLLEKMIVASCQIDLARQFEDFKNQGKVKGQIPSNIPKPNSIYDYLKPLLCTFLPSILGVNESSRNNLKQYYDEHIRVDLLSTANKNHGSNQLSLTRGRSLRANVTKAILTDPNKLCYLIAPSKSPVVETTILKKVPKRKGLRLSEEHVEIPDEIRSWLAKLVLLEGVPFTYLIPDEKMLPPDSIRFFHVDMNWIHALLDGALSIGRHVMKGSKSKEYVHDKVRKERIIGTAMKHAKEIRSLKLGSIIPSRYRSPQNISGFILRSPVVKGWPGLEVNGKPKPSINGGNDQSLKVLRFERLAPTVLVCLFEGDLHSLEIHEPSEGLHFGVTEKQIKIYCNSAKDTGGENIDVPFRDDNKRVIVMSTLKNRIEKKCNGNKGINSASFALHMVKAVGMVTYELNSDG